MNALQRPQVHVEYVDILGSECVVRRLGVELSTEGRQDHDGCAARHNRSRKNVDCVCNAADTFDEVQPQLESVAYFLKWVACIGNTGPKAEHATDLYVRFASLAVYFSRSRARVSRRNPIMLTHL